ncbi:MAG TPA: L,D-transpeptidase/peptidoglycan binding protein [Baekduia sp.]|nr:L,D-transpeptidase/peptidoglycan binding protein [Baekduia sp.]
MPTRLVIITTALLAALIAAAAAGLIYDRGRENTIGKGVVIGGVDVSGLDRDAATAKLRREILAPLNQPITVDHGSRRWRLTAREAKVTTNLEATVDDALQRSREGNILARTWRGLTGEKLHARLQPAVTYSDAAIVRLLDRVRKRVDRPAMNATIKFAVSGPTTTPSHDGLALDATSLHEKIKAALVSPTARRRFGAATHHVKPKVSTEQIVAQNATTLVVNREAFKLTVFKNLKPVKSYSVAIGAVGLDTPAGLYHIQNKAVDPAWTKPNSDWVPEDERGDVIPGGTPQNPLKARWLGIFNGAGIHGVDPSEYGTIGHAASHGCVRMRIPDVEDLYPRVPVGAPIFIA